MTKPIVAFIGRQNAGKSTLLNRIAGRQLAIVEDFPGTTRDRVFADAAWNGKEFTIVDTGGLEFKDETAIAQGVRKQADTAIEEADVVVFLTDVKAGMTAIDQIIADRLRRSTKPVVLAVNKVDNDKLQPESAEFYKLGFDEVIAISGYHGKNVGALLDKVASLLPEIQPEAPISEDILKIAIVGRPNVGKSMLLNTLMGEERSIVADVPGTTRDAIDSQFDYNGQSMILIDTAGIRKRGKVEAGIEWYSVLRSMRAIDRADIALLVVDATEPLTDQDTHIAGYVDKAGKGIIVLVNKWDIAPEKDKAVYNDYIKSRLKFAPYASILYISAKTGEGINKIMPLAMQIKQERAISIPDMEINELIKGAVASHNLPHKGNKVLKMHSARQSGINPPSFHFMVNDTQLIHFSYERFLENRLREVYGFNGTPIRLAFKAKG